MYLSVSEIAERYNMSKTPLYKAVADGRLKCIRLGNLVRIDEDELELYIRRCTAKGGLRR